jgi:SAM-dependent methyltransferase
MNDAHELAVPQRLESLSAESKVIAEYIGRLAQNHGRLVILEAGCGRNWSIDFRGIEHSLIGIDIDEKALALRDEHYHDLDLTIIGDLRTARFEKGSFDVVYNSFVLEHIRGAEQVLNNFVCWLRPGGCIVLKIPNRDSVKGFVTRVTPFWFHVAYKKYFRGVRHAGKPGFGPYPTALDKVVSRRGIHNYCREHGLELVAEYYHDFFHQAVARKSIQWIEKRGSSLVQSLTLGRLSADYTDMMYIIQKP